MARLVTLAGVRVADVVEVRDLPGLWEVLAVRADAGVLDLRPHGAAAGSRVYPAGGYKVVVVARDGRPTNWGRSVAAAAAVDWTRPAASVPSAAGRLP